MEELIQLLLAVAPMHWQLRARLRFIIKRIDFDKGDVIVRAGEVADSIFFIKKGLVQSYYLVGENKVSNWFMKEGDICIEVLSFLERVVSENTLIALEPCECYGISHAELEETYSLFPEFNIHGRLITGMYYCQSERRQMTNKRQTPEYKYEQLMQTSPDLIIRVSNYDMASFLDISERTYNDIRKAYSAR